MEPLEMIEKSSHQHQHHNHTVQVRFFSLHSLTHFLILQTIKQTQNSHHFKTQIESIFFSFKI